MSEKGICSRREADRYIEKGEVLVNGEVVNILGTKVSSDATIRLIPSARKQQANKVTLILNKPVGYVSTQPEKGYKAAIDLLPSKYRKMSTAGRLDIESKGLLVFTDDGTVVKQIIGENAEMEKEYLVRVFGNITEGKLEKLRFGLSLDGKRLKRAQIDRLEDQVLRFVLKEGKKRQIRRMCEKVDLKVIGLKRVRVGKLRLGNLPEGKWRLLKPSESF